MIGASRSLISPDKIHSTVKNAIHEAVNVLGTVDLNILIEDTNFLQQFITAEILDDCILGLDLLHSFNVVIDVKNKSMKFPGFEVVLFK